MKSKTLNILMLVVCFILLGMTPLTQSLQAGTIFYVVCEDELQNPVDGLRILVHFIDNEGHIQGADEELDNPTAGVYKIQMDELPEGAVSWDLRMLDDEVWQPSNPGDWHWQGLGPIDPIMNDAGIWEVEAHI